MVRSVRPRLDRDYLRPAIGARGVRLQRVEGRGGLLGMRGLPVD